MASEHEAAQGWMARFWHWALDVGLILWITRVSLASTLAGFTLFLLVPQARDTFLEVRGDSLLSASNWIFWLVFFFFVLVFWVFPVHYCARRVLNYDPINVDPDRRICGQPRQRIDWLAMIVPRLLATACLIAIAAGALLASAGLRVPNDPKADEAYQRAQAQAEALYQQAHTQTYAIAIAAMILAVCAFLFFIYRQTLTQKLGPTWRRLDENFGRNLLIALTVVFFGLLVVPISWVENLTRAPLIPLLLGGWLPLLAWLALKGRIYHAPFILVLFVALELFTIAGNNHDIRLVEVDNTGNILKPKTNGNATFWTSINDAIGKLQRFASCQLMNSCPTEAKKKRTATSRYSIDKMILRWRTDGAGCDPTGKCDGRPIVVAASGGASRAGFFTAAVLGELVDVTTADPKQYRPFQDQLFAISAVSGSSVGAAYFLTALQDSKEGKPPCNGRKSPLVYFNRAPESWRECMQTLLSGDFISSTLFAYVYKDALRGIAAIARWLGFPMPDRAVILEDSWEDHYRRYATDCESPRSNECKDKRPGLARSFVGLAGIAGPGRRVGRDVLRPEAKPPEEAKPRKWSPLLFLNTTDVDTGRRVIISPVDPRVCERFGGNCKTPQERLFPDAYDLHYLLADNPKAGRRMGQAGFAFPGLLDGEKGDRIQSDVPLSTAAGLSARFPFISPPGNLRNKGGKGNLVARLVDGGYFENFGAGTAMEIADRLRSAGLDPVIIQITNDPELLGALELKPEEGTNPANGDICRFKDLDDPVCVPDPPIIEVSSDFLFSGVRGPVSGLFGARAAQGGRALLQAANSGNEVNDFANPNSKWKRNGCSPWVPPKDESFVHFFVRPQYVYSSNDEKCHIVDVSMSWWLSKPVQAYLNHQVCRNTLSNAIRFTERGNSRDVKTCGDGH